MGYEITCNTGGSNTGRPKCRGNYGRDYFYILVPPSAEIADQSTAETESTWTDAIENDEASRWYPLPPFYRYEPSREDFVYSQGDFGKKVPVRAGHPDGIAYYERLPICFTKSLRDFNDQVWKAYVVTEEGYIKGYSEAGTKFEPMNVFVHFEEEMPATADEVSLVKLRIYLTEAWQWHDYGAVIYPPGAATSWDPRDLEGLLDVDVTINSSAADSLVVDVAATCDDQAITGLVAADFTVLDGSDETQAIDSVTESSTVDGRYTLTPSTTFAAGTVNLKEPSAMTTDGYQTGSAASLTI